MSLTKNRQRINMDIYLYIHIMSIEKEKQNKSADYDIYVLLYSLIFLKLNILSILFKVICTDRSSSLTSD